MPHYTGGNNECQWGAFSSLYGVEKTVPACTCELSMQSCEHKSIEYVCLCVYKHWVCELVHKQDSCCLACVHTGTSIKCASHMHMGMLNQIHYYYAAWWWFYLTYLAFYFTRQISNSDHQFSVMVVANNVSTMSGRCADSIFLLIVMLKSCRRVLHNHCYNEVWLLSIQLWLWCIVMVIGAAPHICVWCRGSGIECCCWECSGLALVLSWDSR